MSWSNVFFVLACFFGISSALKCFHLNKELDFKTIRDKNLVECAPEHPYCIYMSVTVFMPREKSRYPVHFEVTRCSNGKSFEEHNRERYINLMMDNVCDGSLKMPHKWNFTLLSRDGNSYPVMERLNEVKCCTTDGCNKEMYKLIGGGTDNTPWYRAGYNWFKNLF